MPNTKVLIAGGGPVGMTLALVLAKRGIACTLVERNETTTAHPKMDITNARSMELFHGVGITQQLRAVAVDPDHCFDVSWITHLNGAELHRFRYPSVTDHRSLIRSRVDGSQPSESPMRVSQVEIEPVLKTAIEAEPLVDVRFGVAFEDLRQDAEGVDATLRDARTGAVSTLRAQYVVGCDGGTSRVRACLDIGLTGDSRIMPRHMVHFRSDRRDLLQRWGVAWHYQSAFGTLIAQNDRDTWTLHSRFPDGGSPETTSSADQIARFVGEPIEHQILRENPWSPHLLVADAYRRGRVLLAGDAAHQYIPTGGYGMNTGVGDAFDLGWKLAATLQGFGGAGLLDSYEPERRMVGLRNCAASRRHNDVRVRNGQLYTPELLAPGLAGEATRRAASAQIAAHGNAENESWGIELGYVYRDSPIVARESDVEGSDDPLHYIPTTTPGARLPSVFLADGRSVHECLGPWFTLLTADAASAGALAQAATALGVPLQVLQLPQALMRTLYRAPAILVRPDHHVAWRGAHPESAAVASQILSHALGRPTV